MYRPATTTAMHRRRIAVVTTPATMLLKLVGLHMRNLTLHRLFPHPRTLEAVATTNLRSGTRPWS